MAAVHPISLWKQVPSRGGCSSIAVWVSPSLRAASVDLTACCHHLCGCGSSRSSTPCCPLPLALATDPGSLAARSVTGVESLQLALLLPRPWGTAGRSSGPQLCDRYPAGTHGRPSCRVASCKGHPVLGRAERSSPTCPTLAQLCQVLPINRTCSALPSHAPAASQFLWSPEGAAGLGAGNLLACGVAVQPGTGGQVVWAGGLLAGRFLDTRFLLWRTLELSALH